MEVTFHVPVREVAAGANATSWYTSCSRWVVVWWKVIVVCLGCMGGLSAGDQCNILVHFALQVGACFEKERGKKASFWGEGERQGRWLSCICS